MSKKVLQRSLVLGALMTFVITGNVWAGISREGSSSSNGGDYGIEAGKGNVVELDALELYVTNTIDRDQDNYFAIRATETGSITVKNLNATVIGNEWSAGVEATHDAVVNLGSATLTVEDARTEGCEAYGINVARKGNVNVDGDLIATVSGGEWANAIEAYNGSKVNIGNGSSVVTLTSVTNSNEFRDKEWGIRAHGIFAVGQLEDIQGENEDDNEIAYGESIVDINVAKLDISATSDYGKAYGIYAQDEGMVKTNGTINVATNGYSAYGVVALNSSAIELGEVGKNVTVIATCKGDKDSKAIVVYADGENSQIDIVADELILRGERENGEQERRSILARNEAVVNVDANKAQFKGKIFAREKSIINIAANVNFETNTHLATRDDSQINLINGDMAGVLYIEEGNVNLTGATFTAVRLFDSNDSDNVDDSNVLGNGKLVVKDNGVLKTTADQVFRVSGNDTKATAETILGENAIRDGVNNKVTFEAGYLSLSDDYSYEYLRSIDKAMYDINNSQTKFIMTGDLVEYDSSDKIIISNKIDINQLKTLNREVALEKVTVQINNDLQIGGSSNNTGVEVVEKGFSANSIDLGAGDSITITGGKEVTLGGMDGNENIVTSDNGSAILVVGAENGNVNEKGTLNIGVKEDKIYKHKGEVQVNQGSDLNTKGKTEITRGVNLDGGTINVESGQLKADINVSGESTITGCVSGKLTGESGSIINIGTEDKTASVSFANVELVGATVTFDPDWNQVAGQSGLKFANDTIASNYKVIRNNYVAFGTDDTSAAKEMFKKTGFAFSENDINAAIYIKGNQALSTTGSIYVDGNQAIGSAINASARTFSAAANSMTMVDANTETASLSGVAIAYIDGAAKLYIDEAVDGKIYKVLHGVDNGWQNESILTNNQLVKFTGDTIQDGAFSVTAYLQDASEVYGSDVIIADIVDKAVSSDTPATDVFNAAVDEKVNTDRPAQVDALNSIGAMNEVAGVTHTTYAVSNILADAVADHMSLENGKDHDKDIWAHYIHTKEDVDGLKYDVHSTQYSAQYNGIVVGSDLYKEGKATVGAALTYVDGNINGSSVAARTENDAEYYGASIYGSIQNNDTAVIADVSYIHGEHDIIQRNSGKVITGEPETDAFSLGVRVEKEAKAGIGKLVPYAGLRYMHLGTGNYTNSIGLAYDADDAELFLLPVGLKYSADIKNTNGWTMRSVVEFGYVWAFGDTDANQTVSLNGASNGFGYDVTDSGSYVGRFMLEAERANISYALGYEYQKGDDVKADKWMFNVNWKF